jgi:hypothetical protein
MRFQSVASKRIHTPTATLTSSVASITFPPAAAPNVAPIEDHGRKGIVREKISPPTLKNRQHPNVDPLKNSPIPAKRTGMDPRLIEQSILYKLLSAQRKYYSVSNSYSPSVWQGQFTSIYEYHSEKIDGCSDRVGS